MIIEERTLPLDLIGLKHKYVKRTGSAGSYQYYYDEPKTGKPANNKKENNLKDIATEYSDVNTFIKENIKKLKEKGIKDSKTATSFFIVSKMENVKHKEVSEEKAANTIKSNIRHQTLGGWFRNEDKNYKPKLVKAIVAKEETINAGVNVFYNNYKSATGKKISFEEFLNTDVKMYRGGGGILKDEAFTSFSLHKDIAEKFGDKITEIIVKPKDTLGSYQTTAETEVLIPKESYNKIKVKNVEKN